MVCGVKQAYSYPPPFPPTPPPPVSGRVTGCGCVERVKQAYSCPPPPPPSPLPHPLGLDVVDWMWLCCPPPPSSPPPPPLQGRVTGCGCVARQISLFLSPPPPPPPSPLPHPLGLDVVDWMWLPPLRPPLTRFQGG